MALLQKMFRLLIGPAMIVPLGTVLAVAFGGVIYEWPELSGDYEKYLFFQGNIDMGGACLFAATLLLYVVFGFTAGWYLVLQLRELPPLSFPALLWRSLLILKWHLLGFLCGGLINLGYDSRVAANDFRNMFLFACLLYSLMVVHICLMTRLRVKMGARMVLAPLFIVLWLFLGADGNTSRAGQLVSSAAEPHYRIRGVRHGIMVGWHRWCDTVFGRGTRARFSVTRTPSSRSE